MTIAELNEADTQTALQAIGAAFEHSPWVAELLLQGRPFANRDALYAHVHRILGELGPQQQVRLIAAHPQLASKRETLTIESTREQAAAGVDDLNSVERAQFETLNAAYRERFGFPFVICARENTKESIHAALTARLMNDRETEIQNATAEIGKIAILRLREIITA